jgi:hypothetical protein
MLSKGPGSCGKYRIQVLTFKALLWCDFQSFKASDLYIYIHKCNLFQLMLELRSLYTLFGE